MDPTRGICSAHGGHETAKVRDVRGTGGGRGLSWGRGKRVDRVSPGRSVSTPTSGRLQPRTRGNCARQRNKGRNVSWRNGSLQRKSGLDYGMQ